MTVHDLQGLVTARRDVPSPMLGFEVPLLRLLSAFECTNLAASLRAEASPWEVMQATERLWQTLPSRAGLYMFVWKPQFTLQMAAPAQSGHIFYILYVGQTGASGAAMTLKDRYKEYRRYLAGDPERLWHEPVVTTRQSKLGRFLTLRPLEFWYTVVNDPSNIGLLEQRLILFLNPPLNDKLVPRLTPKPPGPAFRPPRNS